MTIYMRTAIEHSLGVTDDFLATFKGYGWYLDDLRLDARRSPARTGSTRAVRRCTSQPR